MKNFRRVRALPRSGMARRLAGDAFRSRSDQLPHRSADWSPQGYQRRHERPEPDPVFAAAEPGSSMFDEPTQLVAYRPQAGRRPIQS